MNDASRLQLPAELQEFLRNWTDTENKTKLAFEELVQTFISRNDLSFDFKSRPGVSHSLRVIGSSEDQKLLALIDVIDDDPRQRWLSVCFYADLVNDPEEKGDLIPGGLLGEDGYCFDLESYDPQGLGYLQQRLQEAYQALAEHF